MTALKKAFFWIAAAATAGLFLQACGQGEVRESPPHESAASAAAASEHFGTTPPAYTTKYSNVRISFRSENISFKAANEYETTDPDTVARIDWTIRNSTTSARTDDLDNNHTKVWNDTGGYSCGLYYDTLYEKAYFGKDGGLFEAETDFARYVGSFLENTGITFELDQADEALFIQYGWTLDYRIGTVKNKLNDINVLSAFNPNAYYFAYNNELSRDIGLDMSEYANTPDIDVAIYRIHESMPQEFYPIQNGRGIVVKSGGKIIGAFISAGRHNAFNACSLKGNSFEKAAGQTFDQWLADKITADDVDARLSGLEPEEVIEEYFKALDAKDTRMAGYCVLKKELLGNLTANMPNGELFSEAIALPLTDAAVGAKTGFDNPQSARLIRIEPLKKPDQNTRIFRVTAELQYPEEGALISGEQDWDCRMVYESPRTGWKIEGFGH
jgi:hypothetical protein